MFLESLFRKTRFRKHISEAKISSGNPISKKVVLCVSEILF